MKSKVITGIMLILLFVGMLSMAFYAVPVVAEEPIKIGVIGPMDEMQGQGMKEGAILAAEQINEAGGVLGRSFTICTGDEGSVPERGTAEMERLCSEEEVHFLLGGFRTEIVDPMREVAMDYRIPFSITGCGTTWLIDCVTTQSGPHEYPCGHCVRCDYDRYKYLFRVSPTNTDVLFANFLVPYMKNHLIPNVLLPQLGLNPWVNPDERIKIACVVEVLDWTEDLRENLDHVGPILFEPFQFELLRFGEHNYLGVSPLTKNFTPILAEIEDKGAHLIFEVFSMEEGFAFIKQWRDLEVPAVPVGINVLSQGSEMWDWTGGRCEYETIIGWMGTRTPITPLSVPFWDAYVERWGHAPIYTSFGAYEAIHIIAEACEQAASDHPELTDPATWEAMYEDRTLYDILIPYMENTDRIGILGRFKFTSTHDVFTGGWNAVDKGQEEYVKPLVVQWRATDGDGRLAVVSAGKGSHVYDGHTAPDWAPYAEDFHIPPWMLGARALTVTSSPITGITFTINGVPQTTPYNEWLLEGSYTIEIPEIHNGYVWSHWLEDGDSNRIKTVTMDTNVLLTAVFTPPDTTPPTISILSPENKTYPVNDVPLTFTVSESTSWMGYSLDGQANVTITGNTTLSGLSDGSHSLIVYTNDTTENTGASEMVYFSIETQKAEPSQLWIVAAIVIIGVVGVALLVYFTKVRKTT